MEEKVKEFWKETATEFLKKKQFKDGLDMVPIQDIKEEALAHFETALEELQKEGKAFKPRHNMIKLTAKEGN